MLLALIIRYGILSDMGIGAIVCFAILLMQWMFHKVVVQRVQTFKLCRMLQMQHNVFIFIIKTEDIISSLLIQI